MNPPSMESIFLILSGAILAVGVLYWFWSHIQLTQKKVQLLENAIFELRSMVANKEPAPGLVPGPAPGPEPVYTDLADDDDWTPSAPAPSSSTSLSPSPVNQAIASTPLESLNNDNPDLQPGGRAEVPSDVASPPNQAEQFRELFLKSEKVDNKVENSESLEAMPVRELRRLAEQRGLTGVSDMKKKELLAALRQAVPSPAKNEVTVERTLDLTESADADEIKGATVLE